MTYTESNHEKENIFLGMIFICLLLILISPILPSFDKKGKTALEVKAKLFSSQPLSRYKKTFPRVRRRQKKANRKI
jgi:hypothetical protein